MPTQDKANPDKPPARREFARRLRELRVLNGYKTARSLARAVGIDENRYTRYERAEVEPDLTLIRLLVAALKTSPNDLLGPSARAASLPPGFQEDGSAPGLTDPPEARSGQPTRSERAQAISWALANAITEATSRGRAKSDRAISPGLARLQAASAVYQQLGKDPFSAVATFVGDAAVQRAPAELQARIEQLVDDLARTLGEAGPLSD